MNIQQFLDKNETVLNELEIQTSAQQKLSRKASLTQIMSYDYLYRKALAVYALARQYFPGTQGTQNVADLVASSHEIIYKDTIRKENLRQIITYRLFRSVYEVKSMLLFTVAVELLGLIAGILWAVLDTRNAVSFANANGFKLGTYHGGFYGTSVSLRTAVAATIFTHNIKIAIFVFLGGLLLGVPTIYLLAFNSLLLGVLGALEFRAGGGISFIRLIVPHGFLEMSCITVAGVAGLRIAKTLIIPGEHSRYVALAGIINPLVDSIGLVSITLVISGFVEALVTTYYLNVVVALFVGLSLGGTFWFLIIFQGRKVKAIQ